MEYFVRSGMAMTLALIRIQAASHRGVRHRSGFHQIRNFLKGETLVNERHFMRPMLTDPGSAAPTSSDRVLVRSRDKAGGSCRNYLLP